MMWHRLSAVDTHSTLDPPLAYKHNTRGRWEQLVPVALSAIASAIFYCCVCVYVVCVVLRVCFRLLFILFHLLFALSYFRLLSYSLGCFST